MFSFNPPGHGDIYRSFYNSGLLQKFIDEGKEYMFVSNIDNLGATVDVNILSKLSVVKQLPVLETLGQYKQVHCSDVTQVYFHVAHKYLF